MISFVILWILVGLYMDIIGDFHHIVNNKERKGAQKCASFLVQSHSGLGACPAKARKFSAVIFRMTSSGRFRPFSQNSPK